MSLQAKVVMQDEKGLGPRIRKEELINEVIDLEKSSRSSNMKTCHTMDQRSTTEGQIKWTKFIIGSRMMK
jgi:hypothetical protein